MKNTYIAVIVLIVLAVAAVLVFGTSKKAEAPVGESSNGEMEGIVSPAAVKEFVVLGKNFSFEPPLITVKRGDKVKITFKNENGFHDFVIDEFGAGTKQSQAPSTEILEFTADKVGNFEYYCSVGSHRQMGMKGTLRVE